MGYKKETFDLLNQFFELKSIEDLVTLLSKEKGIWQHNYIQGNDNLCQICNEDSDHLNRKKGIDNKDILLSLNERKSPFTTNMRISLKKENQSFK